IYIRRIQKREIDNHTNKRFCMGLFCALLCRFAWANPSRRLRCLPVFLREILVPIFFYGLNSVRNSPVVIPGTVVVTKIVSGEHDASKIWGIQKKAFSLSWKLRVEKTQESPDDNAD